MTLSPPENVVYFDGICGLCNRFVDFVLRADRNGILRFAPLQGSTAAENLSEAQRSSLETIVFADRDGNHERSGAALRILTRIGGFWSLARIFYLVPRPLRDAVYDFVANHRYQWFGKRDTCRLPSPEERARFLP